MSPLSLLLSLPLLSLVVAFPDPASTKGTLVFHDEFKTGKLDSGKWYHEITASGGGNGEFQVYTPEAANTFIRNGTLYLKPTLTADKFGEKFLEHGTLDVTAQWGQCTASFNFGCRRVGNTIPPIMSSKIYSKTSIRYGRVEVVAKIPKGDWIWPAIWMLPEGGDDQWKYGPWPNSGEIDIMESRGNANLKDPQGHVQGSGQVLSTIHLGTDHGSGHRQHGYWRVAANGKLWADDYHTYSLDWTKDHINMAIDGQSVLSWDTPKEGYWKHDGLSGNNVWAKGGTDAPFDKKFSLILNVAVGGNGGFFPDGWNNAHGAKPWSDSRQGAIADFWKARHQWEKTWHGDDVAMKIKSVKMYQY